MLKDTVQLMSHVIAQSVFQPTVMWHNIYLRKAIQWP